MFWDNENNIQISQLFYFEAKGLALFLEVPRRGFKHVCMLNFFHNVRVNRANRSIGDLFSHLLPKSVLLPHLQCIRQWWKSGENFRAIIHDMSVEF